MRRAVPAERLEKKQTKKRELKEQRKAGGREEKAFKAQTREEAEIESFMKSAKKALKENNENVCFLTNLSD